VCMETTYLSSWNAGMLRVYGDDVPEQLECRDVACGAQCMETTYLSSWNAGMLRAQCMEETTYLSSWNAGMLRAQCMERKSSLDAVSHM